MSELKRIRLGLARKGRDAYKEAKSQDNAFIVIGNKILRVSADGSKEVVSLLPVTRVKAKQKKYTFKEYTVNGILIK